MIRYVNEKSNLKLRVFFLLLRISFQYDSSPVKKRTTRNLVKMRQEELLRRVPRNVEVVINRLTTRALYDSDKEDKTDLSDDQYSPNATGPLGDR